MGVNSLKLCDACSIYLLHTVNVFYFKFFGNNLTYLKFFITYVLLSKARRLSHITTRTPKNKKHTKKYYTFFILITAGKTSYNIIWGFEIVTWKTLIFFEVYSGWYMKKHDLCCQTPEIVGRTSIVHKEFCCHKGLCERVCLLQCLWRILTNLCLSDDSLGFLQKTHRLIAVRSQGWYVLTH